MKVVRITTPNRNVLLTLLDLIGGDGETYGRQVAVDSGIATGVVYPILARLEDAQWLTSRWEDSDGRGSRRRFYRFTPDGVAQARQRLGLKPLETKS